MDYDADSISWQEQTFSYRCKHQKKTQEKEKGRHEHKHKKTNKKIGKCSLRNLVRRRTSNVNSSTSSTSRRRILRSPHNHNHGPGPARFHNLDAEGYASSYTFCRNCCINFHRFLRCKNSIQQVSGMAKLTAKYLSSTLSFILPHRSPVPFFHPRRPTSPQPLLALLRDSYHVGMTDGWQIATRARLEARTMTLLN